MNGRIGNGKNGFGKGTPKQRIEKLEELLGNPNDRAARVSHRIATILNGRVLPPEHRQALMRQTREQARPIRERVPTAEDDAAGERDNKIWDAMTDAELLTWFQRAAKAAWDELDDAGQQRIIGGLKWVADLQQRNTTAIRLRHKNCDEYALSLQDRARLTCRRPRRSLSTCS